MTAKLTDIRRHKKGYSTSSPEGMERYSIENSCFFDVEACEVGGIGGPDLNKVLQMQDASALQTPEADIGPKYGVKNYLRKATQESGAIIDWINDRVEVSGRNFNPVRYAQHLVKTVSSSYALERNIRETRKAGDRNFYISFISALPDRCKVMRNTSGQSSHSPETHDENILLPLRTQISLGKSRFELMLERTSVGITQHAMERIWERSDQRHEHFHLAIADAYRAMANGCALTALAFNSVGKPAPHYMAVPFLDGMIIMSRKEIIVPPIANRNGWQRSGKSIRSLLNLESRYYHQETEITPVGTAPEQRLINRKIFAGTTFLSRKQIGKADRLEAAKEFGLLMQSINANAAERLFRAAQIKGALPMGDIVERFRLEEIQTLHGRMMPRDDAPDDRIYCLIGANDT